jgi:hypothetical protein
MSQATSEAYEDDDVDMSSVEISPDNYEPRTSNELHDAMRSFLNQAAWTHRDQIEIRGVLLELETYNIDARADVQNLDARHNDLDLHLIGIRRQQVAAADIMRDMQASPTSTSPPPDPNAVQQNPNPVLIRDNSDYNVKFLEFAFDGKEPQDDFERFETNVRVVSTTMGYTAPRVCRAIVSQCRGKALDIAKLLLDSGIVYDDLDVFLTDLRKLFVSPAHAAKAKTIFVQRDQKHKETAIEYHSSLNVLYKRAYTLLERNSMGESVLVDRFIAGLKSTRICELVKLEQLRKPAMPYADLLPLVLDFEGLHAVVEYNAKRRSMNIGTASVSSASHHSVLHHHQSASVAAPHPHLLSVGAHDNVSAATSKKKRKGRRSSFLCRYCRRTGHEEAHCPAKTSQRPSGRNPSRQRGKVPIRRKKNPRVQFSNRKQALSTDISETHMKTEKTGNCFNCDLPGHWARECKAKRKPKPSVHAVSQQPVISEDLQESDLSDWPDIGTEEINSAEDFDPDDLDEDDLDNQFSKN